MLRQAQLSTALVDRISAVYDTAHRFGEDGIMVWTERAAEDAAMLGKLRTRDVETLERLEATFSHDYYRGQRSTARDGAVAGAGRAEPAYA